MRLTTFIPDARSLFCALLMAIAIQETHGDVSSNTQEAKQFFQRNVFPLLQSKCWGCHGEDKQNIEGGLDISSLANLLKGGESGGASVIPGKPDESPLFLAVTRTGKMKMPPKDRNKLSEDEVSILRKWIEAGAIWETPGTAAAPPAWKYDEKDLWAFRPLAEVKAPRGEPHPIDAFIEAKLAANNLKSAPPADKTTLIRRATFDLTGLPPTSEEVKAFLQDKSEAAFEKVIDRLLASPRYGEKWARHWLDVVRYADTDGYSNDYERPNAWRFRDYVIRSFNADKPYDQFVAEQLAGDEINPRDPEKLIAVGMLRMGPWEQTAMSVPAVQRQLFLDDVTSSVGASFLGLTTGCAKCHDHKFDPISAKDYYRLQSCFAPAQFDLPKTAFIPDENVRNFDDKKAQVEKSMQSLRQRMKEIEKKHDEAIAVWLKENGYASLKDAPAANRPKKDFGITKVEGEKQKVLRKRLEYLERELQRFKPQAFSLSTTNAAAGLHVLVGGALESPGESVTPGVLSAVYNSDDSKARTAWNSIPETAEGRRLQLARWIASPQNPLAARVMVNRIWQHHFGKGIVKTSNNFGKMGDKPTHPELLDWLARYFIEHKWSIKEMHRLMMRSALYQQSSTPVEPKLVEKIDPENKLLAHFNPRRLTAEELRDGILMLSGELNYEMGGPPAFPEINLEAALQPRHIMGGVAPVYVPSKTRAERNRRTIYAAQIRSLINPMLEVFNSAPTEMSCERRDQTTVTPQAFALFNSQYALDGAVAMAARLCKTAESPEDQVEQVFLLAYGRKPDPMEKKRCIQHIAEMTRHHERTVPEDFRFPETVERSMVGEFTGEQFFFKEDWDMTDYEYNVQLSEVPPTTRALAELCLVIMNSNEFIYVY